ncbi:MAG: GTP pyrophosphokinase family protein [Eubacterium sp.]|nr:GTP pyrophosphokinase family protein [Eubacterium sp.]
MNDNFLTAHMDRAEVPVDFANIFGSANIDKVEFDRMMMMYSGAIREVKTKLQVLNDELSVTRKRNPIEFIETRIKSPESIANKLNKRKLPLTVESVRENLNDVAGVRVICAFLDDIYQVAKMLESQDDVVIIKTKDYINRPKKNGYRSLHLIVEVPVFFSDRKERVRVEIQIRTIAMDFWASLEHSVKYKKNVRDAEDIVYELRACAHVINRTDIHMPSIRDKISYIE